MTHERISAEPSAAAPPRSSLYGTAGTSIWISMRSRSGRRSWRRSLNLNHERSAEALACLVVEIPTGARVHGGGQHEARREAERHRGQAIVRVWSSSGWRM